MNDREIASAIIAASGLPVPDDEVEPLITAYPMIRQMVSLLYAVDDARYEDGASIFSASPSTGRWVRAGE